METSRESILNWAKAGEAAELPQWEALPPIPLYMDQVTQYLKDSLKLFERDENDALLTSSMINNYVKNQVLPHPEKKKYGKEHLGALMAVCMLKQVLTLQDIKTLLGDQGFTPETYELFRGAHIRAVQETCRDLQASCETGESLERRALQLAAEANAKRAAAERILCELGKEKEKTSKKDT